MTMYLCNAFSLNMMAPELWSAVRFEPVREKQVKEMAACAQSAVGHEATAQLLTARFGFEVPCVRSTLTLVAGDVCLVAQYKGPRLPEGVTSLPEGATLHFALVRFEGA